MTPPDKKYISAEEASSAVTWLPPMVGKLASKVPSAEKEAKEMARRKAERAKESVEEIKPVKLPTANEIAAIFDAARKEGFAEGLAAGQAQGLEQGKLEGNQQAYAETQTALDKLKSQLEQLIVALSGPTAAEKARLSTMLMELTKRLTQKVIMTELSTPSPHIENLVTACIELLPATQTKRTAKIFLHSDDLAYLKGEAELVSLLAGCEWEADNQLQPGGCRVCADSSQLDARVETQLATLFKQFDEGGFANDLPDTRASATDNEVPPAASFANSNDEPATEETGLNEESELVPEPSLDTELDAPLPARDNNSVSADDGLMAGTETRHSPAPDETDVE